MRKTNKQIDQLILQALLSDTGIYNIAEISRRTGVHNLMVKKRIGDMFEKIKFFSEPLVFKSFDKI